LKEELSGEGTDRQLRRKLGKRILVEERQRIGIVDVDEVTEFLDAGNAPVLSESLRICFLCAASNRNSSTARSPSLSTGTAVSRDSNRYDPLSSVKNTSDV
jgi:hypothetical protein